MGSLSLDILKYSTKKKKNIADIWGGFDSSQILLIQFLKKWSDGCLMSLQSVFL